MGIVLFRPGAELMHLLMRGCILLEPEPGEMASFRTGAVPAAIQPLADDPVMRQVFGNDRVVQRAGGLVSPEQWLSSRFECRWPHSSWHDKNFTAMRHSPGSIRLCWHCDHTLSGQHTEQLAGVAAGNSVSQILEVIRRDSGPPESHILTHPELCWWMVKNDLADVIPESAVYRGLRPPGEKIRSVMRESDTVPSASVTNLAQEKAKKVPTFSAGPEPPESFMLRPKRRRWINETHTHWVKTQPCECYQRPVDGPHHIVGHGLGGTATEAHNLFVIPPCRECHDELHVDVPVFEQKHDTQLELPLCFIDWALVIGVIVKAQAYGAQRSVNQQDLNFVRIESRYALPDLSGGIKGQLEVFSEHPPADKNATPCRGTHLVELEGEKGARSVNSLSAPLYVLETCSRRRPMPPIRDTEFESAPWRRVASTPSGYQQARLRYCYDSDLSYQHQVMMCEYVWKTYQKCLGDSSLQERVVKKLIGLVWPAGQEVAATRNNETYKDYVGVALARMASVDRLTWLHVHLGHWAGLEAAFTQLDESALAMAPEYYEEEEALKVAEMRSKFHCLLQTRLRNAAK